jgi:outer membrane immunogenic protein
MRKLLLASAGVLALGAVAASAADLPRHREIPAKAPAYIAPPYNWTGFYVGINGGGGFGRSDFSAPVTPSSFDTSGGMAGGTIGYNYQMGQIIFGAEGDFDWSGIRHSTTCGGVSCETRNNWLSTARGRLGYAFDRFMPYITGGAAFGDVKTSVGGLDNRETRTGWTVDRISPCRSRRRRNSSAAGDREFPQRNRARRHQLPVLTADLRDAAQSRAPEFAPGLLFA